MPPKRKYQESTTIVYGAEVPWLQPLATSIEEPTSPTQDTLPSNPSAATPADDVIWESAKLAYLLYHKLDVDANLAHVLNYVGVNEDTPEHNKWAKKISLKQTQWKGAILNKSLLDHVKEVVRKWHIAHAYKSFKALEQEERERIWMQEYDKDPKRIITAIMKPVIGVVDMANVFNPELTEEEDRAKMSAVRVMLRNKYLFGCEVTYKHRILENRVDACSREWVAYPDLEAFAHTIVPIANVPIRLQLPPVQSNSATKKQKVEAEPQPAEASDVIV
ncbi:hypothetical protein DM02DRAFT_649980 [Periconia macrospinosa]|uniref:Uncharacterized protein n=1 Tax=Periconia macrospinosa TaxID=97972 RepID=A0A2V1E7L7_9PLEO|nr:hypothetical protein DM02DRAFT_649980 [Periconia macrospinosa]